MNSTVPAPSYFTSEASLTAEAAMDSITVLSISGAGDSSIIF